MLDSVTHEVGHEATDFVRLYHQATKHDFGRYANSPGYLDWSTQPDPFRRFAGCDSLRLPLEASATTASFSDLFKAGAVPMGRMEAESVGVLLELSFGLSAWKQHGPDRWALRCNPSSGNLHPTEAYVLASGVAGLADGVHHYVSFNHALEQRCKAELPARGLWLGLSSIHWREAWKYGERAFRYCQHDIGHALGALRYAAGVLGWKVRLLDDWSDVNIASLLGLDRQADFSEAEGEAPDLLCRLYPSGHVDTEEAGMDHMLAAVRAGRWTGSANRLSAEHRHDWPIIEQVARATNKPRTIPTSFANRTEPLLPLGYCDWSAADLIRQRRSAQAFDGKTALTVQSFYRMLDATLPRTGIPPFDAWPWAPRVHLVLFVHRVEGLRSGLYLFCRRPGVAGEFRRRMKEAFLWEKVKDCPERFELYLLFAGNTREAASTLSCHQEIASDGAFSLGMLAVYEESLRDGPWIYRRLFWETGMIGQVLYLEAEAAGVRGTGIGCFFDDPVHKTLGLTDEYFQSLYHFTVGGPLIDARLRTLPPYAHLSAGPGEAD